MPIDRDRFFYIKGTMPVNAELRMCVIATGKEENDPLISSFSESDQEVIAALMVVYDHYAPLIYGRIILLVPDPELAGIITENSFRKIFSQINEVEDSDGSLFNWMLRIAITECRLKAKISNSEIIKKLYPVKHDLKSVRK